MKNKISRWPLFFWKVYSFFYDLSPHKENKEVIPKHTLDSTCLLGPGLGTRLEPKGWAPKSDEGGLLRDAGAECQRVQWGELSLFSQRHKDFGVEIIGEGVQVSGLGDQ